MLKTVLESTSGYVQMTLFIFETIIEFSAAIRNIYVQYVLMNRGLTFTYKMLI